MRLDPKSICETCNGDRVYWIMSEFPIPCPDCNPNSPEYKLKIAREKKEADKP